MNNAIADIKGILSLSGEATSYLVAHELRRIFSSSIIYRKGEQCYVHVFVAYIRTELNF